MSQSSYVKMMVLAMSPEGGVPPRPKLGFRMAFNDQGNGHQLGRQVTIILAQHLSWKLEPHQFIF